MQPVEPRRAQVAERESDMGSLSVWHWVIVLVVVLLIFGTKKLRNVGSDLGGAVKGFKEGMKPDSVADDTTARRDGEGAAR